MATGVADASLVAIVALPAQACSILPPPAPPAPVCVPGESASAYREQTALHIDGFNALQMRCARESQLDVWTRARSVALIEVVDVETDVEAPQSPMDIGVRSTVKPLGWLKIRADAKKKAARAPFMLAHFSFTSCGTSPNWPIFSGKPGDIVQSELSVALAAQVRQPRQAPLTGLRFLGHARSTGDLIIWPANQVKSTSRPAVPT